MINSELQLIFDEEKISAKCWAKICFERKRYSIKLENNEKNIWKIGECMMSTRSNRNTSTAIFCYSHSVFILFHQLATHLSYPELHCSLISLTLFEFRCFIVKTWKLTFSLAPFDGLENKRHFTNWNTGLFEYEMQKKKIYISVEIRSVCFNLNVVHVCFVMLVCARVFFSSVFLFFSWRPLTL